MTVMAAGSGPGVVPAVIGLLVLLVLLAGLVVLVRRKGRQYAPEDSLSPRQVRRSRRSRPD